MTAPALSPEPPSAPPGGSWGKSRRTREPGSASAPFLGLARGTAAPAALAASLFLTSAAVLCMVSLVMPGLIRPGGWRIAFAALTIALGLWAVVVLTLHRLPDLAVLAMIVVVDLVIVLGAACLVDRESGRVAAALFALPSLYLALYARLWTIVPQGVAVLLGTVTIMRLGGHFDAVAWSGTITVLVSVLGPTAAILVLRHRLVRALRRAKALSTTDPLTGLLNRRGITERAGRLVRTVRERDVSLGVVIADVDHFKRINDRHGHAIGDQVLQLVAKAISACVGPDDLVVRLGGEEIAVLTAAEPAALAELAERIRRQVTVVTSPWSVTVSLGATWAAGADLGGDPLRLAWRLVDEADDLMYEAKRAGRNRVSLPAGG